MIKYAFLQILASGSVKWHHNGRTYSNLQWKYLHGLKVARSSNQNHLEVIFRVANHMVSLVRDRLSNFHLNLTPEEI